jgi:hypothetical protein
MKYLTIGKILNTYSGHLTENEIKELKEIQRKPSLFVEQAKALRNVLFAEETDFMLDSGADAKDRAKGKNPMSVEYTERINLKRKTFGVSVLSEAGYTTDNSSQKFCEEVVRQTKNYKELIDLKRNGGKQIVYVDMDNVLVNFQSGIDKISAEDIKTYGPDDLDEVPGIFALMEPNEGAVEGFEWLSKHFDVYILSTAPWKNPSAWQDKLLWVQCYLPEVAWKRLILSHHKNLLKGDFIIDDRTARGVDQFKGKHIHFTKNGAGFDHWNDVITYMKNLI